MLDFLNELIAVLRFRLGILTTFDLLDLLLVTIVYYILFSLIRRSQAAALLRGALVLLLLLVTIISATICQPCAKSKRIQPLSN